jgi:hypothetical protein
MSDGWVNSRNKWLLFVYGLNIKYIFKPKPTGSMAQQYDKVIKENLEKVVLQLIRKTTDIEPLAGEILYPELHYTIEREADFIEKVTTKDNQTLIFHIEFQTANEKTMADRMFVYAGLIYQIYRLPVRQVVFYIGKEPMQMSNTLRMPSYEYSYELIDLQQIPYKQFINSAIPEEVLLAILCNFGEVKEGEVIEEIFAKLRMIQNSGRSYLKNVRQLTVLSLLRDLQPLVIQYIQKNMALTIDIRNDYFYKQGVIETAIEMLKEGIDKKIIAKVTKLSAEEVDMLEKEQKKKGKKNKLS